MDDFREWLSDNLRYFELGGAILLVVLVLFFGIRACRGGGSKTKDSGSQKTAARESQAPVKESEVTEEDTDPVVLDPLTEADKDVARLIRSYYEARSLKDVEGVRAVVDELDPTAETAVENDLFTNYQVSDISTKHGLGENALVAFVTYTYDCPGIKTPVPAVDQLYLTQDTQGVWKIDGDASSDTQISSFMRAISSDADVTELTSEVKSQYDQALASDPALASYLSGLGQEVTTPQQTGSGERMRTTTDVNFRSGPANDASIISVLDEGATVEKTGEDSGWYQVTYNGQAGYVYSEFLTPAGAETSSDESSSDEESSDEDYSDEDAEFYEEDSGDWE